jgi:hypothetical protein
MTWTHSDIIAAIALFVSAIGLLISYLSFRKASQNDEPSAWGELHTIGSDNCWRLSIHLRNRTRFDIKPSSLAVPLVRYPVDAKQDFLLGDYDGALKEAGGDIAKLLSILPSKDTNIKMSTPDAFSNIHSGEEGVMYALLFRGGLSVKRVAAITLSYWSMEETPRYKTRIARSCLRRTDRCG